MPHFKNLVETKKVHIMIIEDESNAGDIYARYGDKLSFLREMKDFQIIKFTPKERSLVLGFGAAFKMDENEELGHKRIFE